MNKTLTTHCLNCNAPLSGAYCSNCGQPRDTAIRSFWQLIVDYFESTFNYDSRLFTTLPLLLFHPGKSTTEYLAGHRARYVPPLRMYLVISLIFFLAMTSDDSIQSSGNNNNVTNIAAAPIEPIPAEDNNENPNKGSLDDFKDGLAENLNIYFSFLSPQLNQRLKQRILDKTAKISWQLKNDTAELKRDFISMLSKMMFFLLPVFALVLKLIYLRKNVLYMEHLIQVIHTHCFLYLALFISPFPDYVSAYYTKHFSFAEGFVTSFLSLLETVLTLYIFYYIYKVIRVVYRQSRMKSIVNYMIASFSYFCLLLVMLPIMLVFQFI